MIQTTYLHFLTLGFRIPSMRFLFFLDQLFLPFCFRFPLEYHCKCCPTFYYFINHLTLRDKSSNNHTYLFIIYSVNHKPHFWLPFSPFIPFILSFFLWASYSQLLILRVCLQKWGSQDGSATLCSICRTRYFKLC